MEVVVNPQQKQFLTGVIAGLSGRKLNIGGIDIGGTLMKDTANYVNAMRKAKPTGLNVGICDYQKNQHLQHTKSLTTSMTFATIDFGMIYQKAVASNF